MSHEGGSENAQRTVAELLAKYGAESGERAPRRRRRRDADDDTGAQAIIDRVLSESGEMPAIREDTPPPDRSPRRHRTGYQRPVEPPLPPPPPARRRQPPPAPAQQQPPPQVAASPPPPAPPQHTEFPRPVGPPSANRIPAIARPAEPTTPVREPVREPRRQPPRQQPLGQPPPRQQTSQRLPVAPAPPPPPPPPVEPTTEELPRVPDRIPVSDNRADTRSRLAPYPEESYPAPYPDSDPDTGYEREDYDRLLNEDLDDREVDERDGRDYDYDRDYLDDGDLDDRDRDEEEEPERAVSPAREWLVMAGQLALGVLGGAAVWLGFNWLWGFLPQAALVVALAVIVGLVLIVRKIRRAEDLQTTVLAVLVGLVVTVSPAALLLLNQ